ncbi:MAG: hypothetical protein IPF55_11630 [Rhodoferax sp.]|nr:hypothetical protein [Rhodoferax sp.]
MNRSHVLSAAILALFGACAQAATDPVALSFERMLKHTPVTTAPAVPANFGTDPLIAAMVEPLRLWQSGGSSVQFARAATSR